MKKIKQLFACLSLMAVGLGTAQAEYALNLMKGVTKISNHLYDLHMLILWICVLIGLGVFGVMFYSIYHHRKSKGHVAAQFHENTKLEIIWTIIPALILVGMAIPATTAMLELDEVANSDMTIKVTGWQWKWEYDYLDGENKSQLHFFSNLDEASSKARLLDSGIDPRSVPNYLLNVDKPLVIPTKKRIRFLFTGHDVIHSWWVPDLGWKKDANPGLVNEAWTYVEEPGTFRGQCTELCGSGHAFMPIVVIAMEQADYDKWVKEAQCREAPSTAGCGNAPAAAVANGEKVYEANCVSCHMADGKGINGTFPALAGSALVKGDVKVVIDRVVNGKGMMPGFGTSGMLNAAEIAAVVNHIRNAFGNKAGGNVEASEIEALLAK